MTTPAVLPPAEVPDMTPLTKDAADAILLEYNGELDSSVQDFTEKNLKTDRGALLEAQYVRQQRTLSSLVQYQEATKGAPLMGALFMAATVAGRKNLTGESRQAFVAETLGKMVGAEVAKSLNLADASEGALFIEGTTLELWLEPLRAASVVLSLNPELVPVVGEQLKVNGFETDPQLFWVEETNTVDISSTPATGERQTAMRKAMALVPVTRDWTESAPPAVFRRLEDLMRNTFRVGKDEKYITGDGLENTVKGLRNHISEKADSAGQTLTQVLEDIETAMVSVMASNVLAERMGYIFAPRTWGHLMFGALDNDAKPFFSTEMKTGTLMGVPFRITTTVPVNLGGGLNESYIILQAFNQFLIGQMTGLTVQFFENPGAVTIGGVLRSGLEADVNVLLGRDKTATLMPHQNSGFITEKVLYGT